MIRHAAAVAAFGAVTLSLCASAAAPQRTFVSAKGNDANPCTLTAPCRGFQAAIDAVAAGGEVIALDSGGYGAMEIHKSVSVIVPPGIYAGISPLTGIPIPGFPGHFTAVLVDIQDTDVVVLRGLNVNHQGTVTGGIDFLGAHGGTLHVENTTVSGFPDEGLLMAAPVGNLLIKDSIFRNNGYGVYVRNYGQASNLQSYLSADHVRIESSTTPGYGLMIEGSVRAEISDSVIRKNNRGIERVANASGWGQLSITRSVISGNSLGLHLTTPPPIYATYVWMSGTTFTDNVVDHNSDGTMAVISLGNNSMFLGGLFTSTYPAH